MDNADLKKVARELRRGIVTATHAAKSGHPGGSLSATEIFTYLFGMLTSCNSLYYRELQHRIFKVTSKNCSF